MFKPRPTQNPQHATLVGKTIREILVYNDEGSTLILVFEDGEAVLTVSKDETITVSSTGVLA